MLNIRGISGFLCNWIFIQAVNLIMWTTAKLSSSSKHNFDDVISIIHDVYIVWLNVGPDVGGYSDALLDNEQCNVL